MNKFLFLFFTASALNSVAQYKIDRTDLEFQLPNEEWTFSGEQTYGDKVIQVYKRTSIVDSQQRNVIANISIITESNQEMDVVTYSALKRGEMPFDVEKVFIPKDIKMKYKNAICYLGTYTDKFGIHKIYFIFLKSEQIGVRIICDVTEELFEQVDEEFLATLQSIK